jgi:hypothetical protein
MCSYAFNDAAKHALQSHDTQAEPVVVQLGVRLIRSAPLAVEKFVHIERGLAL